MQRLEPIEYEVALEFAERMQAKALAAIPGRLQAKEDRFLVRIQRAKVGPLKKLELLYELMEELSNALSPVTPCKKGCSGCCHYMVSVSEIEVAYIEKRTKHRRSKNLGPTQNFHGQPCPFLQEGACSIYNVRPFVCRRHNALTQNAFWCQPERSDRAFPKIGFTNVDGAFDEIRSETDQGKPNDIRQYFGGNIEA